MRRAESLIARVACASLHLLFAQAVIASRLPADLWSAMPDADRIVAGTVRMIKSSDGIAHYSVDVEENLKGEDAPSVLIVVDPHYASTASLFLKDGGAYLLCLKRMTDILDSEQFDPVTKPFVYKSLSEFSWNEKTRLELKQAVLDLEDYLRLTDRGRKVDFILAHLQRPNPYLESHVAREISLVNATEAIPYLEPRLKSKEEHQRLSAASTLTSLKYEPVGAFLMEWLKDEAFQYKVQAIDNLGRLSYKSAIPELQALTNSPDSYVVVAAADALLRMGNQNAKATLFRILKDETNPGPRWNAIYTLLMRGYKVSFSEAEIEMLKGLTQDRSESIARAAREVLEKERVSKESRGKTLPAD